jgi:sigma-B regulation protein RsbU (phosphoserine phosphatase)
MHNNEVERQLRLMGDWQQHLLPRVLPQPAGWNLAACYALGRWPGGDFYDVLPLADGRLVLVVADASDQGAPATALVAILRVVLHACPLSSGKDQLPFCPFSEPLVQPPHILLSHLNRVLVENSLKEQYLRAFCGVLDPVDGNFRYANAGHPYPRWWHAGTRHVEAVRDATGQPLGVDPHAAYHQRRIELEPGDLLVIYSSGLTAALNENGHWSTCQLLDEAIRQAADRGAEAVKDRIITAIDECKGLSGLTDDVTFLVVERVG